ncbi:unknown [Prevotella sp. CAG:485]|nr:unknown [Prevotella sp. CAG:485]
MKIGLSLHHSSFVGHACLLHQLHASYLVFPNHSRALGEVELLVQKNNLIVSACNGTDYLALGCLAVIFCHLHANLSGAFLIQNLAEDVYLPRCLKRQLVRPAHILFAIF